MGTGTTFPGFFSRFMVNMPEKKAEIPCPGFPLMKLRREICQIMLLNTYLDGSDQTDKFLSGITDTCDF